MLALPARHHTGVMDMKQILMIFLWLGLGITTAHASDKTLGDAAKGKLLHNRDCTSCHNNSVYTRPNHIKSLGGLQQRVQMCAKMLHKGYSDDDVANLVEYLNDNYYKF